MMTEQAAHALVHESMHKAVRGRGVVALLDALGIKDRMSDPARTAEELDVVFQRVSGEFMKLFVALRQEFSVDFMAAPALRFYCLGDTLLISFFEESPSQMPLQRRDGILAILMGIVVQLAVSIGLESGFLFRGAISSGEYVECGGSGTVGGIVTMGSALSEASKWFEIADWAGVCLTPTAAAGYEVVKQGLDARHGMEARRSWDIFQIYDLPVKGQQHLPGVWVLKWHKALKDKRETIHGLMLGGRPVDLSVARKMQNTLTFFDRCFQNPIGASVSQKGSKTAPP